MATSFRIGCSGWSYRHWRGNFYPQGLPARRWFEHYAGVFDTVELNTTFYRLPSEAAVKGWRDDAPPGFCFAAKASRLITHFHRLQNTDDVFTTFWKRIEPLRPALGPLLFQLPPRFASNPARLREFLRQLPRGVQAAFEFRDQSWWNQDIYHVLEDFDAAFVMFDQGSVKTPAVRTADWTYVRFHGPQAHYSGGYRRDDLQRWLNEINALRVKTAWVYFNNDTGGHAPVDAQTFRKLGGLSATSSLPGSPAARRCCSQL
jgi:uncharacterized protein YecE (DUF72 family)